MRGIQKIKLPVIAAFVAFSLSACNEPAEKPKTVADYMHDIDAANARLHVAKTQNTADSLKDADAQNASQAVANAMDPTFLKCWPTKPVITANTDHACLDAHGFLRK